MKPVKDMTNRTYRIWCAMRRRCFSKKNSNYKNYGARGITVCKRWLSFDLFLRDMGNPPTKKHSLDRIDNDGNYTPGNCRWATKRQQCRNSRRNRIIAAAGRSFHVTDIHKTTGIKYTTFQKRVNNGIPEELAATQKSIPNPPKGERNRGAKLTEIMVLEIREAWKLRLMSKRAMAEKYAVHRKTIHKIVTRQLWKHL